MEYIPLCPSKIFDNIKVGEFKDMKKLILVILALASLSGCASTNPSANKPYQNQYGGFDSKADADCAFLVFQRDAKKELGAKWDDVYQKCKSMSASGTPLSPTVYNQLRINPQTAPSTGMSSDTLAILQILQAQQAQAERAQRGAAMRALGAELLRGPQQPKTTRCTEFAGTITCNHY